MVRFSFKFGSGSENVGSSLNVGLSQHGTRNWVTQLPTSLFLHAIVSTCLFGGSITGYAMTGEGRANFQQEGQNLPNSI